jgi:IPT/TIG domain
MSVKARLRTATAILTLAGVAAPAAALAATHPKMPTVSSFSPTSVAAMAKIVVVGKNFSHIKSVKVDGLKAKYKVDSATKLTVTIPAKAKSGKIAVTTSAGTGRSAHALKIKA